MSIQNQANSENDLLMQERDALFNSLTPFADAVFYDNGDITLVTVANKAPYVAAFETFNKLSNVSGTAKEDCSLFKEWNLLREALSPFAQAISLEGGDYRCQPIHDREPYITAYFRWKKVRMGGV